MIINSSIQLSIAFNSLRNILQSGIEFVKNLFSSVGDFLQTDGSTIGGGIIIGLIVATITGIVVLIKDHFKKQSDKSNKNSISKKKIALGDYYLPFGCIGRDKDLKLLIKTIKKSKVPVIVYGTAGIGKTTLCSFFFSEMKRKNSSFSMPFISLTYCTTIFDFIAALRIGLQLPDTPSYSSLGQILSYICNDTSRKQYIYFDNWDDLQVSLQGKKEWDLVRKFISDLVSNNIKVLISSQEEGPMEWKSIPLEPLDNKMAKELFLYLLKERGKTTFSVSEEKKFEELLLEMSNHPLILVLTASLIDEYHMNISDLLKSWYTAQNTAMLSRHQSLQTALQMSYKAILRVEGSNIIWGLFSQFQKDFPISYLDIISTFWKSNHVMDEAIRVLRKRCLITYSEDHSSIKMLLPIKKQWELLVSDNEINECLDIWENFIPTLMTLTELSTPESLQLHKITIDNSECFFEIIKHIISKKEITYSARFIELMYRYYESSPSAAFNFLDSLKNENLQPYTMGVIYKNIADILRLEKQEREYDKNLHYYEIASEKFLICNAIQEYVDVQNGIGLLCYWSMKKVDLALNAFKNAEKNARKIKYDKGIGEALKNLGVIQVETYQQYTKAAKLFTEAKKYYSKCSDNIGIAHVIKRMGSIYWNTEDYPKCIQQYEAALEYYRKAHFLQGEGDTLMRLCYAYHKTNDYKNLQHTIDASYQILDKIPYDITKNDLKEAINACRKH